MTIGDGMTITGVAISIASIIIVVLKTKYRNGNGKNGNWIERREHDRMCALIQQGIQERFEYISEQLKGIREDIKFFQDDRRRG